MKKYVSLLWMIPCLGLSFQGCSSDPNEEPLPADDSKVTVMIATQVQTKATVVTQLGDGDAMNVFAKSYNKIDAPDLAPDIKATHEQGAWKMVPEVKLAQGENAFIYAVAPYSAENTNPQAIVVDVTRQEDVLYSGSYVPVSYTTYTAKLTMKHALALVSLNICNQGYSGKGVLQSLSLSGEKVYTKGTMNIESGKVTGTGQTAFSVACEKTIQTAGWSEEYPRIWSIPFSTKVDRAMLQARIDGKSYEARLPEVEMNGGFQYIFRLVLTDYGLEFIPDQTETISLNIDTDRIGELKDYGVLKIAHSSSRFALPVLGGDNVFGSVDWGDGEKSAYSMDGIHTYAGNTTNQLLIESWNSSGFTLKDMVGVEVVDVSQY